MNLNSLSWPLFVLVTIFCGISIFVYSFSAKIRLYSFASFGFKLMGISAISFGLERLVIELNVIENNLIFELVNYLGIAGIVFMILGVFQKFTKEKESEDTKFLKKVFIGLFIYLTIASVIVLYFHLAN